MKKFQILFLALILGTVSVTFTSCGEDDPCKDVVCGTNGDCFEGSCVCNVGYEQDASGQCTVEQRTKFLGANNTNATYKVVEDGSNSAAATYFITIEPSSTDITKVLVANIWNTFANKAIASISGNKITFARQEPDSDKFFVEGTGTITGNVITMVYTVSDETGTTIVKDDFTGSNSLWTKQ